MCWKDVKYGVLRNVLLGSEPSSPIDLPSRVICTVKSPLEALEPVKIASTVDADEDEDDMGSA